jgi:hypothetical protein
MSKKTLTYVGVILVFLFLGALIAQPLLFSTDETVPEEVSNQ